MKVFFVRHGQTDWNVERKIQGQVDIELNDEGRKQAAQMRDELADMHFDAIFVSPLARARETAEIIAEPHESTPVVIADELAERNFGEYEGKDNDGGKYYGLWQYDNPVTPNGETPKDLEARVYSFLDRLHKQYERERERETFCLWRMAVAD